MKPIILALLLLVFNVEERPLMEITVEYMQYACEPSCANFLVRECNSKGRCKGLVGEDVCLLLDNKQLDDYEVFWTMWKKTHIFVVKGRLKPRDFQDIIRFKPRCVIVESWQAKSK